MNNKKLQELLEIIDTDLLKKWILNYAKNNPVFGKEIMEILSPKSIKKEALKDYPNLIRAAFNKHPVKFGNRYRGYDYDGFEAENVRADLEEILEEVDFFLKHKNTKAAVHICKCMIEIIPEEWDEQFDYEGDVQVMYDDAIDKLEMMLKNQLLPDDMKSDLFEWYKKESKDISKHKYVGLNTSFDVLQRYFLSSEEMITENLKSLDEKIKDVTEHYYKERYIIEKIEILEEIGSLDKMQQTIDEYIEFTEVRRIKLDSLVRNKEYAQAIELIQEGIAVAEMNKHAGTVSDWKDELLRIYQYKNDKAKVLQLAEDLLFNGREQRKYYEIIKTETPAENWDEMLTKILSKIKSEGGLWGFNHFRADILVEYQKWDELFVQCKKGGVNYLADYEKYLRPEFNQGIYDTYLKFIEQQATITDQKAYENVAHFMKRLKTFPDGEEKVRTLVTEYREVYKRRKNMMKELKKI